MIRRMLPAAVFVTAFVGVTVGAGAPAEHGSEHTSPRGRVARPGQSPIFKDRKPLFGDLTAKELEVVDAKSDLALRALADFWRRSFQSLNRPFTAPNIVRTQSRDVEAHYHPRPKTIFYNPLFFVARMNEAVKMLRRGEGDRPLTHPRFKAAGIDGDMAFITILAHEYGHAVQDQLGKLGGRSSDVELQADSLAGAFVGDAMQQRLIEPGDRDEATFVLLMARDSTGVSPNHPQAHAPGADRVEYFNKGYNGGLTAALWR